MAGTKRGLGNGGAVVRIVVAIIKATAVSIALGMFLGSAALAASHVKSPKTAAPIPEAIAPQDVDGVVAGLSDEQARAMLRERLRIEAQKEASRHWSDKQFSKWFVDTNAKLRDGALRLNAELPLLSTELRRVSERLLSSFPGIWLPLVKVIGIIVIAAIARSFFLSRARRYASLSGSPPNEAQGRDRSPIYNVFISLSGLLVYALLILLLFAVGIPTDIPAYNSLAILTAFVLVFSTFSVLVNTVLSLEEPRLRLIRMSDEAAASWRNILLFLGGFLLFGAAVWEIMLTEGLPESGVMIVRIALAFLLYAALVAIIITKRRPVAEWFVARRATTKISILGRQAGVWHIFAVLYLSGSFLMWLAVLLIHGAHGPHVLFIVSILPVPAFFLLDRLLFRMLIGICSLFRIDVRHEETSPHPDEDEHGGTLNAAKQADPPAALTPYGQARAVDHDEEALLGSTFFLALVWSVRLCLFVFSIFLLLYLWDMAPPLGTAVVAALAKIFLILLFAFLAWEFLNRSIQRRVMNAAEDHKRQRILTLLPLLQKGAGFFIVGTAVLMAISEAGVHIGPLLASAGVFGLALGLGMQAIVKDLISGAFFLLDDSIRVGDNIEIGNRGGRVMRMSLRTITLRHSLGHMMIVPYGDIKNVVNYSRGPLIEKLKIPMPLDTDPGVFRKVVKSVNEELMQDEELKNCLVRPVKSQGIRKVSDSGIEFGVKFTAKPGSEVVIKREVYSRLYAAFKKKGLSFAVPGVVIYGGKGGETEAAAAKAVRRKRRTARKTP